MSENEQKKQPKVEKSQMLSELLQMTQGQLQETRSREIAGIATNTNTTNTATENEGGEEDQKISATGSNEQPNNKGTKKSLSKLIEEGDWPVVRTRVKNHPEEVKGFCDSISGWTILHDLCYKPPAPEDIFRMVIDTYPKAVSIQEKNYLATPLHIMCWTSQRSVRKVQILIETMKPEELMLRNRFGGTVLHSACGSHASLQVIQALVRGNPKIVLERTYEYNHTALTALWHCHLQSIPGHMQIARILEGDDVTEGHFERFWEKVVFLAKETFKLSSARPKDIDDTDSRFVLHGLMNLRAPLNTLKVALKRTPEWAFVPDNEGNYPLHHVVIRRPFRLKDVELISELIQAYPEAAGKENCEGNSPLFIAIHNKMDWEDGLKDIATANVDMLASQDKQTGLYPFLLAASLGGKVAVNTTYQLLSLKPYLVKEAIPNSEK